MCVKTVKSTLLTCQNKTVLPLPTTLFIPNLINYLSFRTPLQKGEKDLIFFLVLYFATRTSFHLPATWGSWYLTIHLAKRALFISSKSIILRPPWLFFLQIIFQETKAYFFLTELPPNQRNFFLSLSILVLTFFGNL